MNKVVTLGLAVACAAGFGRSADCLAQSRSIERVSSLFAHLEPASKNDLRHQWGKQTDDGKKITFATSFPSAAGKFRNQIVQLDRATNTLKVVAELAQTAQQAGGAIMILDQNATGSTLIVRVYFEQADFVYKLIPEQLPPGYLESELQSSSAELLLDTATGKFTFINLNLANSPVIAHPTRISPNGRYVSGIGDRGEIDEIGIYRSEYVFVVRDLATNTDRVVPFQSFIPVGNKPSVGDIANVDDTGKIVVSVSWTAEEEVEDLDSPFYDGVFFADPATQAITRIDKNSAANLNCESLIETQNEFSIRSSGLTYTTTPQNDRVVFRKKACGAQEQSIWSWDRANSSVTLIRTSTAIAESVAGQPFVGQADLTDLDLSPNGQYLTFNSISAITANDKSKAYDMYLLDLPKGTNTLVTVDAQARQVGVCDTWGVDNSATIAFTCSGQTTPFAAAPANRDALSEFGGYLYVSSLDQCPADNDKIAPGAFGCGTTETDTNVDGVVEKVTSPGGNNNGGNNNGNGNENGNVPNPVTFTSLVGTLNGRKLTCQALNGKAPVAGVSISAESKKGKKVSKLSAKTSNSTGKTSWTVASGTQRATCFAGNLKVAARKVKK